MQDLYASDKYSPELPTTCFLHTCNSRLYVDMNERLFDSGNQSLQIESQPWIWKSYSCPTWIKLPLGCIFLFKLCAIVHWNEQNLISVFKDDFKCNQQCPVAWTHLSGVRGCSGFWTWSDRPSRRSRHWSPPSTIRPCSDCTPPNPLSTNSTVFQYPLWLSLPWPSDPPTLILFFFERVRGIKITTDVQVNRNMFTDSFKNRQHGSNLVFRTLSSEALYVELIKVLTSKKVCLVDNLKNQKLFCWLL